MSPTRKTRQQKIQKSQRKGTISLPKPVGAAAVQGDPITPAGYNQEIAETQLYVVGELKRIGWISALCVIILIIATIFLADFGWAQTVRDWLSL